MTEAALRHVREVLSQVARVSPVDITVINHQGRITFANPRAEEVLGLTKDNIVQRTYNAPDWLITDYQDNRLPDRELPFARVMATGRLVRNVHHAIEPPDGRKVLLYQCGPAVWTRWSVGRSGRDHRRPH